MKKCKQIKIDLAAYAAGELDPGEADRLAQHLRTCPGCRQEYQELTRLLAGIESLEQEGRQMIDAIDWDQAASDISRQARLSTLPSGAGKRRLRQLHGWRLLGPAMAALFFLGLWLGYLLFHSTDPVKEMTLSTPASAASLDRIESALNRREVLDYLKETQLVLMDLLKEQEGAGPGLAVGEQHLGLSRARLLLARNRYFTRGVADRSHLLAARGLLEKIQWLLIEMVVLEEDPAVLAEQLQRIRTFIREERLLMKIRLVEEELAGSADEV
jgi:hypothetical protein